VTVLARQRQALILERIREDGAVRVADLVRLLGVSDMTVRRDLESLHEQGLVEKVHGGATARSGNALFEPGFAAKSALQQHEKEAIAAAAVALVEPGMAIGLSAGTTTYALARALVDVPRLTVVTNSIPVADALYAPNRSDQTIILTGGVRTPSDALVGPFAVGALRSVHLDIVFMGVHGMEPRSGFTTPNMLEAETDRALIEAGRRLVVVADHSKWGVVGISSIARLDEADVLITDAQLEPDARSLLADTVHELIVVPQALQSQSA
jgi:DeoR/GlpR family transcriptional regulator of sugar metabolism